MNEKKCHPTIINCQYQKYILLFTAKNGVLNTDVGVDIRILPPCHSSLLLHKLQTGGGRWSYTTYQTRFYMAKSWEQRDWSSMDPSRNDVRDLVSILDPIHPNFGADDLEALELEPPALIHEYEHFHEPEDSDDQF